MREWIVVILILVLGIAGIVGFIFLIDSTERNYREARYRGWCKLHPAVSEQLTQEEWEALYRADLLPVEESR